MNPYVPCQCGSGKKFKFCCQKMFKSSDLSLLKQSDQLLSKCASFPVYRCSVREDWAKTGISPVIVTRELGNGSYVFISYLIDFWCLGFKDSIIKVGISKSEIERSYNQDYSYIDIEYQDARSLILGAIDFAKSYNFSPTASWQGVPQHFIEWNQPYQPKFTFGQKGKPMYCSGPRDHELYNMNQLFANIENIGAHYITHA